MANTDDWLDNVHYAALQQLTISALCDSLTSAFTSLITHGSTLMEVNMALVLIACVITGTVLGHRVAVSLGVAS